MDRPCEVTVKRLTRHVHSDWLHDAGCLLLVVCCWLLFVETLSRPAFAAGGEIMV